MNPFDLIGEIVHYSEDGREQPVAAVITFVHAPDSEAARARKAPSREGAAAFPLVDLETFGHPKRQLTAIAYGPSGEVHTWREPPESRE